MSQQQDNNWHLDRKVTLSIMVAILLNAGASIWWGASLNTMVMRHEMMITENKSEIRKTRDYQYKVGARLAKIETSLVFLKEITIDIKKKVEK